MKNKLFAIPFLGFALCALIGATCYGATHQYVLFIMCFCMFRVLSEVSISKLIIKAVKYILSIRIRVITLKTKSHVKA